MANRIIRHIMGILGWMLGLGLATAGAEYRIHFSHKYDGPWKWDELTREESIGHGDWTDRIRGTAKITGYSGNPTNLVIPKKIAWLWRDVVVDSFQVVDMVTDYAMDVVEVGGYAFFHCTGLTGVTIPDSVTDIGECAFWSCSALTRLVLGNGLTNIGTSAFADCSSLTGVAIPRRVTDIGDEAFARCSGLTGVTIGNSARHIGNSAFAYCGALTGVTIPDSVTDIGECVFYECGGLTNLTIGHGVRSIGGGAFAYCGLTDVTIPCNATNIPWNAFMGCSSLANVAISDGVTSIGDGAFAGCSGLTHMTIPDSVTDVGEGAFMDSGLKMLYVPLSWKETAMLDNAGIPDACTVVYGGMPGAELALAADSRTFTEAAASGLSLEVTANLAWTAQSSASWLAVGTTGGNGNGTIEYAVAANPGTESRTGTITVGGGGLAQTFTVIQSGMSETQDSPVGVPWQWLDENAAGILAANGGDHEAAALARAANGLPVWQCYVAGLSTTDADANLKMKSIFFENGDLVLEWDPDLNRGGTPNARSYTVLGKPALADDWGPLDASSRFFRVRVELP